MKKIISLLLTVILIVSMIPATVRAAGVESTAVLTVEEVSAAPGGTVDINLVITENPGILGATLRVSWDESLTLIANASGEAFADMSYTAPSRYNAKGTNFVWYANEVNTVVDGVILTLTFRVAEDVENDEILPVRVTYLPGDVIDGNENDVILDITDGGARVITYKPGDVNNDGRINVRDLVRLSQYISDGCTTDPEGYNAEVIADACDVTGDGRVNTRDLIRLSQYISDGSQTDPDGYNAVLYPAKKADCAHEAMTATEAKAATCTEEGHIAYWYCDGCAKYFGDAEAANEIALADTIIAANGHTPVVDAAVVPSYTTPGLTEGSHCDVCGQVIVAQQEVPKLEANYHSITYHNLNGAEYPDLVQYAEHEGVDALPKLELPGYTFVGWYTAPNGSGAFVDSIEAGSTKNYNLYAYWTLETYTIYFRNAPENSNAISTPNTRSYTVEDRIVLADPKWNGLKFVNWTDENGKPYTEIPKGTTGDLELTANWKVQRNLANVYDDAKEVTPFYYDPVEKTYYFVYKIGTLEHVVLDEFVLGDNLKYNTQAADLTFSLTDTVTMEDSVTKTIGQTVSKSVSSSTEWQNSKTQTEGSSKEQHFDVTAGMDIGGEKSPIKVHLEASYGNSSTTSQEYSTTSVEGGSTEVGNEQSKESSVGISYMEQISSSVTKEITISADKPIGYYSYVHAGNVNVLGIVAFNAQTGNYSLATYSFVDNMHEMTLYYPDLESLENPAVETLPYDVPIDAIIEYVDTYSYVNYVGNGGEYAYTQPDMESVISGMEMSVYEKAESKTLPKNLYTKTGYHFTGWSLTPDGEVVYKDEDTVPAMEAGEVLTLYAQWAKNDYTIAYDANLPDTYAEVSDMPQNTAGIYDEAVTLGAKPTYPGWSFDGWYLEPECTTKVGDAGQTIQSANLTTAENGTVTLYAKWTLNTYKVTYHPNGNFGTAYTINVQYRKNSTVEASPFGRTQYTLEGWSLDPNATVPTYRPGDVFNYIFTEDVVFYAVWSKTMTIVDFGEGAKDRHYIHWKTSGFNQGRTDGKDKISPNLDKAHLKTLGYTKIKVKVEFYYRVDDWGTQLIKLYNNQTGATLGTPAQHEWDERGWSWGTEEFVFSLDSTGDGGEFWILWDLAKDENQSDTWYVGGTTVTITAIY